MFGSSGIVQASSLIQAMCEDDDDDDDDENNHQGVADQADLVKVEPVKMEMEKKEEPCKEGKEGEKPPAASEAEIKPLMSVTPALPSLMGSGANLLTDLDALLGFIQKNYKSCGKHPFSVPKPAATTQ